MEVRDDRVYYPELIAGIDEDVGLAVEGVQPTVERLAGLYQSGVAVLALDARDSLAIIGIGVGLGLLGSWFAVARHMRAIEPK